MTWVIAGTTMLGDVILLSDIQVSWDENGQERHLDCLRKVYPIQPNVAVGFSGNIKTAFAVLARFEEALKANGLPPGHHWQAPPLLDLLQTLAAEEFRRATADGESPNLAFIFASVQPHESVGSARRPIVCVLEAPEFAYAIERRLWQVQHIGSGSSAETYKRLVERFFSREYLSLSGRGDLPWFMPSVLRMELNREVAHNPEPGVSHWFHDHLVTLQWSKLGTDRVQDATFDPGEMPEVASSYDEYRKIFVRHHMNQTARA